MLEEIVKIQLKNNLNEMVDVNLYLYEEDPDNCEYVKIELQYNDSIFEYSAENYFDALIELRKELEKKKIQILCEGANKNIYPSAMQLNMGTGRNAYRLVMNKQATDVVDIFKPSSTDECTTIKEQQIYFELWIKSLEE